MNTLYFNNQSIGKVLDGSKTTTWRILLDTRKRRSSTEHIVEGEIVRLASEEDVEFARVCISKITRKTFREINSSDYEGHEVYNDIDTAMAKFGELYETKINLDTPLVIIKFYVLVPT